MFCNSKLFSVSRRVVGETVMWKTSLFSSKVSPDCSKFLFKLTSDVARFLQLPLDRNRQES